jgi:DNA-binding LytR/AlgR family response regulator
MTENGKIKALIIDDEISGRTMIEFYLNEYLSDLIESVHSVSNIADAELAIREFQPDIVFTDIELRGENGLSFAPKISKQLPVVVISAHSQYAIKAIQNDIFDYLLKPLEESEILRFRSRLIKLLNPSISNDESLIKDNDHLVLKEGGETVMIPYNSILFIEAWGAYSKIITPSKNYLASKTLKILESKVPRYFVRVHRSYIVPIPQIASFRSGQISLKSGQTIGLSKTGKKLLQELL